MGKWEMVPLGMIFDIGSSKRVFESEWRDTGIPFYRAREIAKLAKNGTVENELFIEPQMYEKYAEKYGIPTAGDIMVTGVGTLGVCYIVKPGDKFYFKDGNILWFKKKINVSSSYISWVFKTNYMKEQIERHSSGTTVGTFTIITAKKIEIPLPPLPIQRQIANVLDRASALIEKRKAQIDKLDLLVKSRFVEMFGDPVINEHGWERGKIRDIVTEVKYGTSKPANEGGYYPYLRMNNITYNGQLDLSDLKYIDISDSDIEKCIVRNGDVLFNRTNSKELVGKTCVFNIDEPMVIAGYIIRIRLNKRAIPVYLSAVLNSDYGKSTLRTMCKQIIGQANINAQELQGIEILIPPLDLQNRFAAFVKAADKSKFEMRSELAKLEVLYKSLMQKCFRGEIF